MKQNTAIAILVTVCLLIAGGIGMYALLSDDADPDYYENPYYTVSY
jgi:hypothetical protein